MDRYKALTVLAVVAKAGSMRRAARILGMTPSGVSQHIAQLERETHVALLHRSARQMSLTDAGEALAEGGAGVLAAVQAAELRLAALHDTPTGELAIGLPAGAAERRVVEALAPMLTAWPGVSLRLIVTDDPIDLLESRIDIAVAIGVPPSTPGVVRRLASWDTIVCAAPSYLARHGRPHGPADLHDHACLSAGRQSHRTLDFIRSSRQRSVVRVSSRVTTRNATLLAQLAIAGGGVLVTPQPAVADELADGRLTPILTDWHLPQTEVTLITAVRLEQPAKVRYAVEALERAFDQTAAASASSSSAVPTTAAAGARVRIARG